MEERTPTFTILKTILKITIAAALAIFIFFYGSFDDERRTYIEANTSNTGIVTDKTSTSNPNQRYTKYTITIERPMETSTDEPQTKSETYTITYDEWLQIKEGYVAVYNNDGSINILPPSEAPLDAERAGTVTHKSPQNNSAQSSNKYTVEIERYSFNSLGEVVTETETYTVSFTEWSQIGIGHIATYNEDGSIDINPPGEGASQPRYQPPEPFGQTFLAYTVAKSNGLINGSFAEFFSDITNIKNGSIAVLFFLFITWAFSEKSFKLLDKFLCPYADDENEEYMETDEEDEEEEETTEDEEFLKYRNISREKPTENYSGNSYRVYSIDEVPANPSYLGIVGHTYDRTVGVLDNMNRAQKDDEQGPNLNQPQPNLNQELRLTVGLVRTRMDSMDQLEIIESYQTLSSGYNCSFTKDYDDREVTRLSISSSFSPKLTLDITPKSY